MIFLKKSFVCKNEFWCKCDKIIQTTYTPYTPPEELIKKKNFPSEALFQTVVNWCFVESFRHTILIHSFLAVSVSHSRRIALASYDGYIKHEFELIFCCAILKMYHSFLFLLENNSGSKKIISFAGAKCGGFETTFCSDSLCSFLFSPFVYHSLKLEHARWQSENANVAQMPTTMWTKFFPFSVDKKKTVPKLEELQGEPEAKSFIADSRPPSCGLEKYRGKLKSAFA